MASGDPLVVFRPDMHYASISNSGVEDEKTTATVRYPVIDVDDTTNTTLWFPTLYMPDTFTSSANVTFNMWGAMTGAGAPGEVAFDITFDRLNTTKPIGTDSFDTATSVANVAVPSTAGNIFLVTVTVNNADLDGIQPGEFFGMKVVRVTDTPSASGDFEFLGGSLVEI